MFIKFRNKVIDIKRETDETDRGFNKRAIFILKNLFADEKVTEVSDDDLISLSHVYKWKDTLQCTYPDHIEAKVTELQKNMYLDLKPTLPTR